MTSVERVKQLLNMELVQSDRDDAGVIVASRVDTVVRRKAFEDVIKHLKAHEVEDRKNGL